jgi:hypothetical protein
VEEVADAVDRPTRRKKKRSSSCRCAGGCRGMDAGAPPLSTALPRSEIGAPPIIAPGARPPPHHPGGGSPRHGRVTSMHREGEVESRRKRGQWRGGRGEGDRGGGGGTEEECGKEAAGGCRMGGVGVLGFWGKERGAPLYVVGRPGPQAIVPAHGPHRATDFVLAWADTAAQHSPTSCSCRPSTEIIVLGPCSCWAKISCFGTAIGLVLFCHL